MKRSMSSSGSLQGKSLPKRTRSGPIAWMTSQKAPSVIGEFFRTKDKSTYKLLCFLAKVVIPFVWGYAKWATTSLSLGEHWEVFIKNEVASGRYGSASEVVRDALRHMEDYNSRLAALRAHLAEGEAQALQGDFVQDYSIDNLLSELDQEG